MRRRRVRKMRRRKRKANALPGTAMGTCDCGVNILSGQRRLDVIAHM